MARASASHSPKTPKGNVLDDMGRLKSKKDKLHYLYEKDLIDELQFVTLQMLEKNYI